jgi:5-hydroxyisourate hydrolase
MSTLSTHVLDTQWGRPAAGVPITLEAQDGAGGWRELSRGTTNSDGRVKDFLPAGTNLSPARTG